MEKMENYVLTSNLKQPEYLKHYVKYKVWVEHKPLPTNLLKNVSFDIKIALLQEWNKQWREYKRQNYGRS